MPELPDIECYCAALRQRVEGRVLERVRIVSPFLLRTFEPPIEAVYGRRVNAVRRMGKRIVLEFGPGENAEDSPAGRTTGTDATLYLVLHLMIAGRLRWGARGAKPPGKIGMAAFEFDSGTLLLTEASPQKRAALHVLSGASALTQLDAGGIDVLAADVATFAAAVRRENHTLKRALTDPRLLSGIGNAYSDEILHAAQLSPVTLTSRLSNAEVARLHAATQQTLIRWRDELLRLFADRFPGPGDITAFRPGFAVHGKFGQPCPSCDTPVQRIRYADNETNYCPTCQTGGRVLADRSLSRLLKDDWPRRAEDLA